MEIDVINKLVAKISLHDDERAFKEFFDLYYVRLFRLAQYYLESIHASEEIMSIVFTGVWNNRKKLISISKLDAYLLSSVKYKCINYIRDTKRNDFISLNSEEVVLKQACIDPAGDLLNKELREKILHIINSLPPRCKLIFEMVKDDGLKYKEVAEILDISIKAVEAQVSKAMLTIRKEIYPYIKDEDFAVYDYHKKKGFMFFL